MSLTEVYREDLRDLVDALNDRDVFAPGEAAAWHEGIDEAEHMSDLVITNDGLVEVVGDRDGFDEVIEEVAAPETGVFV